MAWNTVLAQNIRQYLQEHGYVKVQEKKMFGGLAFLVDGKMCINVNGDHLMCRFDPHERETVSGKAGYLPVNMKGKQYNGYCYVEPAGFETESAFEYWMQLCLRFNPQAKSTAKKR